MSESRSGSSSLPEPVAQARITKNSVVTYRLGGRNYPMRSVSTCRVCQDPDRIEIERRLIHGYGPTPIHRSLSPQAQDRVSVRNIMDHARKHLPVDHMVRQAMIDSRTKELGQDIEEATGSLVDHIVFMKTGLQKAYERMVDGEIKPSVQDGITLATLLLRLDEQAGDDVDQDMMARGFMAYMAALRQVCSPEQVRQMSEIIKSDPIMTALLRRGEEVEEIIDAEILP